MYAAGPETHADLATTAWWWCRVRSHGRAGAVQQRGVTNTIRIMPFIPEQHRISSVSTARRARPVFSSSESTNVDGIHSGKKSSANSTSLTVLTIARAHDGRARLVHRQLMHSSALGAKRFWRKRKGLERGFLTGGPWTPGGSVEGYSGVHKEAASFFKGLIN